ncbi:ABC transporter permease [Curtobacterium ammoniigenes]|uniref:ABC transporter permease n=1 Tax=Curtobacterium ammoniigenes TaxID=395387 RepID=UPI00082AAB44|nr:ABC transporter permease [Curtobacterium ammoniigenes]
MNSALSISVLAVTRRWRRQLLTVAAVAVGTATLVCVQGLSETAAHETAATVDRLRSNRVIAALPHDAWTRSEQELTQRIRTTGGALRAGTYTDSDGGAPHVSAQPPLADEPVRVASVITTAEGLDARGARIVAGTFSADPDGIADGVLIGAALAKELRLSPTDGSNTLRVNGVSVFVSGVVRDGLDGSSANTSVLLPPATAQRLGILPEQRAMQIMAHAGNADALADVLPVAVFPEDPENVSIGTDPSPEQLRRQLLSGSRAFVVSISTIVLISALAGFVTTMQIAVRERRREIGIGRAMGETRASIGTRFLLEATILGLIGGAAGFALGVLVAATGAQLQNWSLILRPELLLVLPASALVGAAAGAFPAWTASRVNPADLLRTE